MGRASQAEDVPYGTKVAGRTAYTLRSAYCVTRWTVIDLSHTLAAELSPHGIRVNAVVPGPIEGERSEDVFRLRAEAENKSVDEVRDFFTKDIPIGRMPTEQEVANSVVFLASDSSKGIHGQTIQVDGGFRICWGWQGTALLCEFEPTLALCLSPADKFPECVATIN